MGAVLKIQKGLERFLADKIHRKRPDKQRADAQARRDNRQLRGKRESAHDSVQRKSGIKDVQIQKQNNPVAGDALGLDIERSGEPLDKNEQDDADNARAQYRRSEFGQGERKSEKQDQRERYFYRLDPPPPREMAFHGQNPVNALRFVEKIFERDNEKERTTERADGGADRFKQSGGLFRIVERDGEHGKRRQHRGGADDAKRQNKARAENGDENAPREKTLLPFRAHLRQHFRVDDGIVEGKRHLQNDENERKEQRGKTAPHENGKKRHHRNR